MRREYSPEYKSAIAGRVIDGESRLKVAAEIGLKPGNVGLWVRLECAKRGVPLPPLLRAARTSKQTEEQRQFKGRATRRVIRDRESIGVVARDLGIKYAQLRKWVDSARKAKGARKPAYIKMESQYSEELLAAAKIRRLEPSERRHVIEYLESVDVKMSTRQLAALFRCHEKAVRQDRKVNEGVTPEALDCLKKELEAQTRSNGLLKDVINVITSNPSAANRQALANPLVGKVLRRELGSGA